MSTPEGSLWGPPALPRFLAEQLRTRGLSATDASTCASRLLDTTDAQARANLFVDLGSCKFLEGDVDGAIASWRHALTSDRDDAGAQALLNLGLLYEHLHLHDQAIAAFASVTERGIEAYTGAAAMATARSQQAMGDAATAMETMARLAQANMRANPESEELAESLYGLGEVASEAGRLDRAERAWRAASASVASPAQRAATDRLAQLLLDQGHDDELLDLLEREPTTARSNAGAFLDRAQALQRLGNEEEAAAIATAIDGDDLKVGDRFRLAEVRLQVGFVNQAIDELEVLLVDPSIDAQQRAGFLLGEVYRSYEMSDAATSMYERVIEQRDGYWASKALLSLGDVFQTEGQQRDAVEHWTRAATSPVEVIRARAQARLDADATSTEVPDRQDESDPFGSLIVLPTSSAFDDAVEVEVASIELPIVDTDAVDAASAGLLVLEEQDSGESAGADAVHEFHDADVRAGAVMPKADPALAASGGADAPDDEPSAKDHLQTPRTGLPIADSATSADDAELAPVEPLVDVELAPVEPVVDVELAPVEPLVDVDEISFDDVAAVGDLSLVEPDASADGGRAGDVDEFSFDDAADSAPREPATGVFGAWAAQPLAEDDNSALSPSTRSVADEIAWSAVEAADDDTSTLAATSSPDAADSANESPAAAAPKRVEIVSLDDLEALVEPPADLAPTVQWGSESVAGAVDAPAAAEPDTPAPAESEPPRPAPHRHEAAASETPSLAAAAEPVVVVLAEVEEGIDLKASAPASLHRINSQPESVNDDAGLAQVPAREPARPDDSFAPHERAATELAPMTGDAVVVDLDDIVIEDEPVATERPLASSAFASLLGEPDEAAIANPYAALAPEDELSDVAASTRNPYAELAPNFADDDFQPDPDVEPGDWESMLDDDWQRPEPKGRAKRSGKKRSSAFSRYT